VDKHAVGMKLEPEILKKAEVENSWIAAKIQVRHILAAHYCTSPPFILCPW
jgi:hypothetical protein